MSFGHDPFGAGDIGILQQLRELGQRILKIETTAASGGGGAPSGPAGGVLSGSYPNPGFAADMATQAELDAVAATIPPPGPSASSLAGAGLVPNGPAIDVDPGNGLEVVGDEVRMSGSYTGTFAPTLGVNIPATQTYKVNGSQISSGNLSDATAIAMVGDSEVITGSWTFRHNTQGFSIDPSINGTVARLKLSPRMNPGGSIVGAEINADNTGKVSYLAPGLTAKHSMTVNGTERAAVDSTGLQAVSTAGAKKLFTDASYSDYLQLGSLAKAVEHGPYGISMTGGIAHQAEQTITLAHGLGLTAGQISNAVVHGGIIDGFFAAAITWRYVLAANDLSIVFFNNHETQNAHAVWRGFIRVHG